MQSERTFFLQHSGVSVLFKKRKGVKRLTIRINKKGQIFLTMPYFVSFREAEKFLLSKQDWIENTLSKIKEANPSQEFSYGKILETHFHSIFIEKTDKMSFSQKQSLDNLSIYIPEKEDIFTEKAQHYIRSSSIELLRREAKKYLPHRLRLLAEKYSYSFCEVRIKNMKTRWGSCSSKNNINLNLHLMRLPYSYIDYVLLHELVHTVHKNHGEEFWNELNRVSPSAFRLSKIIRKISPETLVMISE
jgi:predicted metal-dependent hydrolase